MAKVLRRLVALAFLACLSSTTSTKAKDSSDLVGTWFLHDATVSKEGVVTKFYGDAPNGILCFDEQGNYSLTVIQSSPPPPRFESGKKNEGAPYEYKFTVHRSIANYGRFEIDKADGFYKRVLVLKIKASTFSNWDGMTQRRPFKIGISSDKKLELLEYRVPNASSGGTATLIWKRPRSTGGAE